MRRSQKPVVIACFVLAVFAVLLLLLVGVAWRGLNRVPGVAAVVEPDRAEREAVRAWLRENTPTGKWEEVRWSKAASLEGKVIFGEPLEVGIRLKYRTTNSFGGISLLDEEFFIKDGIAASSPVPYRLVPD